MSENQAFRIVFVTVPDLETGRRIAHQLLTQKLAACINIIPGLESHYVWETEIQFDHECLLLIKTSIHRLDSLKDVIKLNHPYDTPEIVAVPITEGSEKYLTWIHEQTSS